MTTQFISDPQTKEFLDEILKVCDKYKIDLVPKLQFGANGIAPFVAFEKREEKNGTEA